MQKDKHPDYQPLVIVIDGEEFLTNSTSKEGRMIMDVSFKKHPAWTGKGLASVSDSNKNVSSFNKKFAGLSFLANKN
ncbi:MAG: 50S ribosomal protein L31 [Rickettsiaceae bacterium]|nr:50S ribosomal protein L31 [Rickettsiaceae bacterium]